MEAGVGAGCVAFAGEHACGRFTLALECENTGRVGEAAWQVFLAQEAQEVTRIIGARKGHARNPIARQGVAPQLRAKFAVAHLDDEFVGGVVGLDLRPRGEHRACLWTHLLLKVVGQGRHVCRCRATRGQQGRGGRQVLHGANGSTLLLSAGVVAAHRLRDLSKVSTARRRHDGGKCAGLLDVDQWQRARSDGEAALSQVPLEELEQGGDAVIREACRRCAVHRHVLPRGSECLAVANELASHVATSVLSPAAFELVDRYGIGEVEHVDLLELRCRTELRSHDIKREVDEGNDPCVALADARGFNDDEIVGCLAHGDDVGKVVGNLRAGTTSGQRSEVDRAKIDGVHADAVAQKCTATLATSGIHSDDRDGQLALLVDPEAAQQFIGEGGLAGASCAGDAQYRCCAASGSRLDLGPPFGRDGAGLKNGDGTGQ